MADHPAWQDVRREFSALVDLAPDQRRARLEALPPGVRVEVEALLAALDSSPDVLDLRDEPRAPEFIGPYRVLGEIGRGGMGVVYRAERADGEVTRQVAVKLAGGRMFAPEAERRFIRERQILAGLDHPHIVRLLDGGLANGQRYLVMELVEGSPITEYARTRPLHERLRLLIDVCAAIHYAHQRLVLHRDLKPGNIVVNAAGEVKVLDFGIAQVLRGGDTGTGPATGTMLHPLSIASASPEQLRGEPLSLASDVYSLGVLLYELATGRNPRYEPDASFDENLRRALDEDLPPPSRLAQVPRDLDAIALKALARRPEDRYASVAALQADLERLLEGRPVLAVAPRAGYLLRRFVARNKALTAAAALLVAAVVASAAIYVRQSRIEQRRFEDARRLVHTVVFDIQPRLESIPATLPLRQTLIEETLVYLEAVSRDVGSNVSLLRELANSYAQLAVIQGDALAANLGDRQASARHFAQAAALMDRALALAPDDPDVLADASVLERRQSEFALQDENRPDAVRRAQTAIDLAERSLARRPGDAVALEARAMAWYADALARLNADADRALERFDGTRAFFAQKTAGGAVPAREAALVELWTADLLIKRGDKVRAPQHARESLRLANLILAARPDDQTAQLDAAMAAGQLASILYNSGDQAGAVEHFKASAEMRERIVASDPGNVRARERLALAKGRLGTILARAGDFPAARAMLDRSIVLYEELLASGQLAPTMEADFAEVLGHLGDYHTRVKDRPAACAAFRRAATILQTVSERIPLSTFRKQMLEFNLGELERCK